MMKPCDSVSQQRGRSPSRAALVCLGLLCLLLLAGITGLGLHYQGFRVQYYTMMRDQQLQYSNLTAKRDQLETSYNTLTAERDQLEREKDRLENSYNTQTAERDQLENNYNTLTAERDQLERERDRQENSYNTQTAERDQLENNYNTLTAERDQLERERDRLENSSNTLTAERDQLERERDRLENSYNTLIAERDQLKQKSDQLTERIRVIAKTCPQGWEKFGTSCYYISTEKRTWEESRQDCLNRGADLVVIDSREEQRFLLSFGTTVWIGLTDKDTEGTWTWVDTSLTNGSPKFWAEGEPNDSHTEGEDCAQIYFLARKPLMSWNDIPCSVKNHAVCEKQD
ncbi:C-type lectin domain family 4 member M-like [Osmerus mordax]|uniref:C-type lectin domain family 4 member M-like n=1 Tax=Osmerus mordax TaxID=8014 RepID=UPI003510C693